MKSFSRTIVRKIAPVLSTGLLLQAGGCTVDANSTLQQLVTTATNNLIADYVFGAFNLGTFGGF